MNLKKIKRTDCCPNCGTRLNSEHDNFCPHCGQVNNIKKETALGLIRELVEEFLHMDSKVSNSLIPLLIKPGQLTAEYNSGRRARYFHPVRLFLTVTIIMFVVSGIFKKEETKLKVKNNNGKVSEIASIDSTNEEYGIDSILHEVNPKANISWDFGGDPIPNDSINALIKRGITDKDQLLDSLHIEKTMMNRIVAGQIIKGSASSWKEIKEYYLHRINWIIFSLMPVFAFVMWLVYYRRKIYFVDHLVYAFHTHTAVFLLITLLTLFDGITGWSTNILLLYIPVYYYLSIKRVYNQTWTKTFLKGTIAGFLYLFIGAITFAAGSAILLLLY